MAKDLQVGNDIYPYPEEGENPGWGEDATAWAEGVTEALSNLLGPNDILISSATLNNNQTTFANISGLAFNTGEVQAIEVDFFVIRIYDSGASVLTESGKMLGNFNGSEFVISVEQTGDAGMDYDITNAGQIQYKSSNLTNHVSTIIRYRGKTIDQP